MQVVETINEMRQARNKLAAPVGFVATMGFPPALSQSRLGPGDAQLVEDTTGQGSTTRVVSEEPVIPGVVPLAE